MALPVRLMLVFAASAFVLRLTAFGRPLVAIGSNSEAVRLCGVRVVPRVIGGARLVGGRGSALDILIGVLTLGVIGNIMNLRNVPGYHQEVVQGVIILVAVLLQSSPRRA